jgi:2-polyprenyl-6-methoxyphenol hydroxylase-like FAD-dependent oxidoreductase
VKIAIIGCGVGGQAAALFLKRAGHDIEIFERFPEAKPIGAGLLLQPPGQAALDALGLFKALAPKGARVERLLGRTPTQRTVLDLEYARYRTDYAGLGIHRAHLFEALHRAVREATITLHLDAAITDIPTTDRPVLRTQRGEEHGPFDLALIAEGAHSLLRTKLAPQTHAPVYRWGALWTTCPDQDGRFARTLWQLFKRADKMIGVLPIGHVPGADETQHVAMFWSLECDRIDDWRAAGLAAWKSEVLQLWPETAPLLEHITSADQLTLASYCDVVMRDWRKGRCLFIGDAAHGTSPQLGQGANLALIDAWTLAHFLAHHDIDSALALYERARRAHVGYYQLASRWLTPFFQSHSRALPLIRDAFMGPFCRLPLMGDLMVSTLCGVRCWPLGLWQPPA